MCKIALGHSPRIQGWNKTKLYVVDWLLKPNTDTHPPTHVYTPMTNARIVLDCLWSLLFAGVDALNLGLYCFYKRSSLLNCVWWSDVFTLCLLWIWKALQSHPFKDQRSTGYNKLSFLLIFVFLFWGLPWEVCFWKERESRDIFWKLN